MKKVLFAYLAIGAAVLASCSNEEMDVNPAGGEGNVVFTAELPASLQSRAYSDGLTATNLTYAVYEAGQTTKLLEGTATFVNLKATVSTTLATGKSYDILFWAQADGAPYSFNPATQTVTVSYDGATSNAENRDAFFHAEKALAVNGPVNKTISLTRPFAQVNIGSSDFAEADAAGLSVTETAVSVAAYSTLNLATGDVAGEAVVDFALAAIPTYADGAFPVTGYKYLAMNYILVPAEKQTVDVTFSHNGSSATATFASVPVQRNYRTNIYGALLTNPAVFEVEIDKEYETPDNNHEVVVASTAQDVADAFNAGKDVVIPEGQEIDMSSFIGGENPLTVDKPTVMTINGTLKANAQGRIDVTSELTVIGKPDVTSRATEVINGGVIETGDDAYGIFNAKAGSKLIVKDVTFRHTNKIDGCPIGIRDNAEVELINCVFDSDFGTVQSWKTSTDSKLTATNCTFKSTSNSARNGKNWTYCVNIAGPTVAVLNNCIVEGVQGGVATVKGAHVTINGGSYSTHKLADEPNAQNFYALYIAQEATAVVYNGDFYAEGMKCVYNGNNDQPGDPLGYSFLKGGRYADQGYMQVNPASILYPAEGYKWEPIEGDPIYKWTIVEDVQE